MPTNQSALLSMVRINPTITFTFSLTLNAYKSEGEKRGKKPTQHARQSTRGSCVVKTAVGLKLPACSNVSAFRDPASWAWCHVRSHLLFCTKVQLFRKMALAVKCRTLSALFGLNYDKNLRSEKPVSLLNKSSRTHTPGEIEFYESLAWTVIVYFSKFLIQAVVKEL